VLTITNGFSLVLPLHSHLNLLDQLLSQSNWSNSKIVIIFLISVCVCKHLKHRLTLSIYVVGIEDAPNLSIG